MNKIFAIGDIHGSLTKLRQLMEIIPIDRKNDTLLFIGDYIDRGKSGTAVVDYIIDIRKELKKVICLMGNHEHMFLRYLEGIAEDLYLQNGGIATVSAYDIRRSDPPDLRKSTLPEEHALFFFSLLTYYETPDYIFVHAGLKPGVPVAQQTTYDLMWIRQEFIASAYDFGKLVVFGHTPMPQPLIMPNKIGIDTGAVFGGKLTCLELPDKKFYQV